MSVDFSRLIHTQARSNFEPLGSGVIGTPSLPLVQHSSLHSLPLQAICRSTSPHWHRLLGERLCTLSTQTTPMSPGRSLSTIVLCQVMIPQSVLMLVRLRPTCQGQNAYRNRFLNMASWILDHVRPLYRQTQHGLPVQGEEVWKAVHAVREGWGCGCHVSVKSEGNV